MVVRRGVNESSVVPMARWARETGVDAALHRVHGRRPLQRLAAGRGRARPQELIDTVERGVAGRAGGSGYRGEVAGRWRYLDGLGEFGIISSVTLPFCRDCTRARLSADGKLYTCLFAVDGPGRPRGAARRLHGRGAGRRSSPTRGAPATIATPSCGARHVDRPTCPRSRCSRWAADAGSSTGLSTACTGSWIAARRPGRRFVDKRVDPPRGRPPTVGPARRGRQDRRNRDHIKGPSFRRRSLRALRCPRPWLSHHGPDPRGTPDGTRSASRCRYFRRADEACGPRASTPWT